MTHTKAKIKIPHGALERTDRYSGLATLRLVARQGCSGLRNTRRPRSKDAGSQVWEPGRELSTILPPNDLPNKPVALSCIQ